MIAAFGWLASPLARISASVVGMLGAAAILYGIGHHNGVQAERVVWRAKAAEAAEQARRVEARSSAISATLKAGHQAETTQIEYRTKTLIQKVPEYVPHAVDCPISAGFVSLYNAAASGSELPRSPIRPVEAPAGIPLSTVAETDAYNLGLGHQFRDEAQTWRAWYAEQAKLRGSVDISIR